MRFAGSNSVPVCRDALECTRRTSIAMLLRPLRENVAPLDRNSAESTPETSRNQTSLALAHPKALRHWRARRMSRDSLGTATRLSAAAHSGRGHFAKPPWPTTQHYLSSTLSEGSCTWRAQAA